MSPYSRRVIQKPEPKLSLLQPCHCGSGRKYRRCCWPREAARDRALRPRLISLLKEMELNQSRASEPTASFDLSFLWEELGLKRP
jgi:hypothetical protein